MQHVVRRQTLELTLPEQRGVHGLQEQARRIVRSDLAIAMDKLFSSLVAANEVIELERVEIDLGDIASTALDEDLVERARERLEEVLSREIAALRSSPHGHQNGARIIGSEQSRVELVRTFLLSGAVPWWAPGGVSANVEVVLRELLEAAPGVVADMLRSIAVPRVVTRIVKQFSPATRRLTRTALAPSIATEIEQAISEWARLLAGEDVADRTLPSASGASITFRSAGEPDVQQFVESAVLRLLTSRTKDDVMSDNVSQYILTEVAAKMDSSERSVLEYVRERSYAVLPTDSVARAWLEMGADAPGGPRPRRGGRVGTTAMHREEQTPESDREARRGSKPAVPARYRKEETSVDSRFHSTREVATHDTKRDTERQNVKNAGATSQGRYETREHSYEETEIERFVRSVSNKTGPLVSPSEPASIVSGPFLDTQPMSRNIAESRQPETDWHGESPVEEEGQYIENAGITLIWPYLRRFFQTTGLVESKAFCSEAAQERAVLLLQHIGTGEIEWSEPVLLLNKILCGWPVDEPVAKSIEVTEIEAEESRELLASIIENWKALKSTSVAGLRSSFLQREGLLRRADEGWKLTIARTGYDVLLDQLPWGISFVLLPWMDQPLFVEW